MPLLSSLASLFEPALIREIGEWGRWMQFKEGDVIMDYGQEIHSMPIVVRGTIKVLRMDESGKELLLYYLSQTESCSMAYNCCLESKRSEVKAIAEDEVEIVSIPQARLGEWLCKYPSWKSYIMRSFNERFLELLKSIEMIAFRNLDERLVSYLKDKQRLSGSSLVKVSHYQIAEELATSRVVVSRLLKQLENDGRILLYRNEIKVLKGL